MSTDFNEYKLANIQHLWLIYGHLLLFQEESFGHAGALGKSQAFFQRRRNEEEKWMPNVTLEERYETLRNDDKWD